MLNCCGSRSSRLRANSRSDVLLYNRRGGQLHATTALVANSDLLLFLVPNDQPPSQQERCGCPACNLAWRQTPRKGERKAATGACSSYADGRGEMRERERVLISGGILDNVEPWMIQPPSKWFTIPRFFDVGSTYLTRCAKGDPKQWVYSISFSLLFFSRVRTGKNSVIN